MAVKPTIADARWDTDLVNNTAPTSGRRDTGFPADTIPTSDELNVLLIEAYRWALWAQDEAFSPRWRQLYIPAQPAGSRYLRIPVGTVYRVRIGPFEAGERVTEFRVHYAEADVGTIKIFKEDASSPTPVQVGSTHTTSTTSYNTADYTGLTEDVVAGTHYYLELDASGVDTMDIFMVEALVERITYAAP